MVGRLDRGITGRGIGDGRSGKDDAAALYDKLSEAGGVALYYENRIGWIAVMKGAIAKNASFFNSHRMLRRYTSDAYVR